MKVFRLAEFHWQQPGTPQPYAKQIAALKN
jgi:hypothetical protein